MKRATLSQSVSLPPLPGVLSRRPVAVRLEPVEVGQGLLLTRADLGESWPVSLDAVQPGVNCTALGNGSSSVAFVEHLLAALAAAGISDVRIVTDGPEIPLYDGSARVIWDALRQAGRQASALEWEPLVIGTPVRLEIEGRVLSASPADHLRLTYELDHPHPLIGQQTASFEEDDDFGAELAWARTFATREQLAATRQEAPWEQIERVCLVVYEDHLSERPPLPAAFARHKLVDLIGDLFLCGRPLLGEVVASRTGHSDNHAFLRQLVTGVAPA
jgi:UDP-3-O-acyl-N-acetylglucosamine deacetylase